MNKSKSTSFNNFTSLKKKNYERLIDIALDSLEHGIEPTITELADKSGISRSTAYRYFPTQNDLISALVNRSLDPILQWHTNEQDISQRVNEFISFAYTEMIKHEGAIRATLRLSLQQWAMERSQSTPNSEKRIRENRKEVISNLLQPLQSQLSEEQYNKVIYTISLICGSQITVLKDVWNLDDSYIISLSQWIANAIINQAKNDANT